MLKTRVITALALLAIFLVTLFVLPEPSAAIVFGILAGLMAWEWAGLMRIDAVGRFLFAGVILASCYYAYEDPEFSYQKLWAASAVFWLAVAPLWLWRGWRLASNDIAGYLTGWLLIVPTWAALVALQDGHPWRLFIVMGLVWIADISAYFAGRAWGRHKLAPAISPGKTWEGVGGAVVGVGIYSVIVAQVAGISPLDKAGWLPMLLALTAVSVIGDLFESMIKRQAGVKDSSQLLPGHGGFLDRLDSQTSMLPLAALLILGTTL
ncbi:MAG: phosphatidate cytidylyltransferase [Rhodocyclales bacterium]|nr:phosphatidate cytidylyltransferase [Rhodocyclales bacterium]